MALWISRRKAILGTADALVEKGDFKGNGTAFKDA